MCCPQGLPAYCMHTVHNLLGGLYPTKSISEGVKDATSTQTNRCPLWEAGEELDGLRRLSLPVWLSVLLLFSLYGNADIMWTFKKRMQVGHISLIDESIICMFSMTPCSLIIYNWNLDSDSPIRPFSCTVMSGPSPHSVSPLKRGVLPFLPPAFFKSEYIN